MMFERFTERARMVVVHAQQEARDQNQDYIGTEHVLLGLLREEKSLGAIILNDLGVSLETTREKVLDIAPTGEGAPDMYSASSFTPHANGTFKQALLEARALGHNFVGTEHELLSLIRDAQPSDQPRNETGHRKGSSEEVLFPDDEKSIVGEVLTSFDIDLEEIHDMIVKGLLREREAFWKPVDRKSA